MSEVLPDGLQLAALEVGDLDGSLTLYGADHGPEHKLQDGLLAEGDGDDLQARALLEEQSFKKVGRADRPSPARACPGRRR